MNECTSSRSILLKRREKVVMFGEIWHCVHSSTLIDTVRYGRPEYAYTKVNNQLIDVNVYIPHGRRKHVSIRASFFFCTYDVHLQVYTYTYYVPILTTSISNMLRRGQTHPGWFFVKFQSSGLFCALVLCMRYFYNNCVSLPRQINTRKVLQYTLF